MGAGFSIVARGKAEADVFLYEDIGPSFFGGVSAKEFAGELKALGAVDVLNVRLNSSGGDVFDGMAIYSQLKQHPARVVAHVDGLAASIASVIAMAGDEIRISEGGFMMIHNAAGGVLGEATDMRKMADLLDKVTGSIADVYAERTGQKPDALLEMMAEETWFTGDEAVRAGFADQVVVNLHVAAKLDPAKHKFRHAPAALAAKPAAVAALAIVRPQFDSAAQRVARMRAQSDYRLATSIRA